ncbi:transcription factor MafB-like [Odontomachus brunneus]|uniref:transcription factor MafB-like n=1 Tax=Odontomachus brunneus TaxID=486640 RepID=UPI0013F1839C|nr:transcription factor MafB-like [Odontomachus brunneus]
MDNACFLPRCTVIIDTDTVFDSTRMQPQHEQRRELVADCCYQQWPAHHHHHHHHHQHQHHHLHQHHHQYQQLSAVPSPMQQMEGELRILVCLV